MGVDRIHVRFSDDGSHIRKWAFSPFDGAEAFVPAIEGFGSLAEAAARASFRLTASTLRDTAADIREDRNHGAEAAAAALIGCAEAIDENLESMVADVVRAARAHLTSEAVTGAETVQ